MLSLARVLGSRTAAVVGSLLFAVACGGDPSVSSRPHGNVTPATGGMDGSGGNSTGATGGTGILPVGGQGGGEDDGGSGNVTECDVPNPPPKCFNVEPSGPGCGDGEINQAEEECDDGNGLPGDGCSGICVKEPFYDCKVPGMPCELTIACGDGEVNPGEFCDDGNTNDDDGCSADCEMQDPDYVCPDPGEPCTLLYDCGDSRVNGTEECDDGNEEDNDGCDGSCNTEDGYRCRRPGQPCELDQDCGDGAVQAANDEECDDGNDDSGDGCSGICTVEPYHDCPPEGGACVSTIVCGDGEKGPGEVCDDGNTDDDDGCSADCHDIDPAYICPDPGEDCTRIFECGDGRLHKCDPPAEGCETCDDGDTDPGDGCDADCQIEPGYLCRKPGMDCVLDQGKCGDGTIQASRGEECDDNNTDWDDGCYGDCTIAPYYDCPTEGMPCVSTIVCGDGARDPGEQCDDDDTSDGDGCDSDCKTEPNYSCTGSAGGLSTCKKDIDCGDRRVSSPTEECDDGNKSSSDGCSSTCQLEAGYVCPTPGSACSVKVVCGDGKRAASEQCDDGDTTGSDGCSPTCKIESEWSCTGAVGAASTCSYTVACGDGKLGGTEVCDDGNTANNDGCSSNCLTVETGFKCVRAGNPCVPICGDGVKKGSEQCDPTPANLTACNACRLTPGYTCGAGGLGPCVQTVCGNASPKPVDLNAAKLAAEDGEGCDDGNTIAGDGCGPTCQLEPPVTVGPSPVVNGSCGDGLKVGSEGCDDGNDLNGDGCSSACVVETGWSCSGVVSYPASVEMKLTYRDFKHRGETGGHPHMRRQGQSPPDQGNDMGITGAVCTVAVPDACGRLDPEGKPTFVGGSAGAHPTIRVTTDTFGNTYHQDAFKLWYRDSNASSIKDYNSTADGAGGLNDNIDVWANPTPLPASGVDTLVLPRMGTTSAYQFSKNNNQFYPLGCTDNTDSGSNICATIVANRGYGSTANASGSTIPRNWNFTSELRYFFQYNGTETLTFYGDDDVWVFINGRLAVDIGGIHGTLNGRVVLGDDGADGTQAESNCSIHVSNNNSSATLTACALTGNEATDGNDKRFGLTSGNLYEIVVFQAERHPTGSNYQLTLDGFIAPRSSCTPICGKNPAGQGGGVTVTPPEECDDGDANVSTVQYGKCLQGTCTLGPYCGDGNPDAGFEECDNGVNNAQYGQSGCAPGCVNPPTCGDGNVDSPLEECDLGAGNTAGGYNGCKTVTCELGPRCGDGNPDTGNGEACDDGVNDGSYGTCSPGCTPAPRCGDGNTDTAFGEECDGGSSCDSSCRLKCGNGVVDSGEACDDGILAGGYNRCGPLCVMGPTCGDGTRNGPEECDDGVLAGGYDECGPGCVMGGSCGDGYVNGPETCDDGLNDGFYNGCTEYCTPGPSCGDSVTSPEWGELCDDGAEPDTCNGCQPLGSCGDAVVDPPDEECDDGVNAGGYGLCAPGCIWDAKCGDGVVQGPWEECDETDPDEIGGYDECTADCEFGPRCGDGIVTKPEEKCDDGINDEFYGSCTPDCQGFGPRCGDEVVQDEWGEECDDPDDANCENCRLGAQCGDNVKQSGEECDDGVNDGGYGQCGPSCKYGPRCGDGVVQKNDGEECDLGEGKNDGKYGGCENTCKIAAHCGDGHRDSGFEECDDGNSRNGDGCTQACKKETQIPK